MCVLDAERCPPRDRRVYKEGRLSYADFVWFLISEEDKKTDTRWDGAMLTLAGGSHPAPAVL